MFWGRESSNSITDLTCKALTAFSLDVNRWTAWNTNSKTKALYRSDLSGLLVAPCSRNSNWQWIQAPVIDWCMFVYHLINVKQLIMRSSIWLYSLWIRLEANCLIVTTILRTRQYFYSANLHRTKSCIRGSDIYRISSRNVRH